MPRRPPKSLAQLAAEANSQEPMQIAGKPADVCPYCGAAMFVSGTRQPDKLIRRYVWCRNKTCGRKFESQQPPAVLVREIDNNLSSSGRPALTLIQESA